MRNSEDDDPTGAIGSEIDEFIDAEDCNLGILELGVGAVSYALSAAEVAPASSCRSHLGTRTWSPFPIVYCMLPPHSAGPSSSRNLCRNQDVGSRKTRLAWTCWS